MRNIVLYRPYDADYEDDELAIISKHFDVTRYRSDIKAGDLVIGRYSLLPFYREQAEDIEHVGASVINSYAQHRFIANISNWYPVLEGLTPETWFDLNFVNKPGPYVLKGETNSKRQKWSTHMYAAAISAARSVYANLMSDDLISSQGICIRQFVELEKFGEQVTGLAIANEYRFFVCDGQVLGGGYYWSSCVDDLGFMPNHKDVPEDFLNEVIGLIGSSARFYALDVAKTKDGKWTVIELNDGSMSGMSCCSADEVFGNLKLVLERN